MPTAVLSVRFASGWPYSALRVGVVASDGAACERRNVILRSKLYQRMEAIHGSGAFAITWGAPLYNTRQLRARDGPRVEANRNAFPRRTRSQHHGVLSRTASLPWTMVLLFDFILVAEDQILLRELRLSCTT